MNICDDCGECHDFDYGDRVRLVQNHMLTGQVIGERNWGTEYLVRLGATVTALWFNDVELEPDEEFYGPAPAVVPDSGEGAPAAPANDNVINFADRKVAMGRVH
jgi:hypothetical protein